MAVITSAANRTAAKHGFVARFEVDLEEFPAGHFDKAKQYILLDTDEKGNLILVRKGAAMKGSSHPALFDRIIESVGMALLRDGRAAALEVARKATDLRAYAPQDFIQRASMNKRPEDYQHDVKELKIARAHNKEFGTPIEAGRSYEYVRTRDGLLPPTPANLAKLDDWAYLSSVVIPALERLGFSDLKELGLEERASTAKARSKRPSDEISLAQWGL
jgi:hypothetical protein